MKDKKGTNIVNAFQSILDSLGCNQTKYGLMKVVNFITVLLKKRLKENHIKMYSTYNEGKSVAAERFMETLKNKIYNI